MTVICNTKGAVVRQSRNLRALMEHARHHAPLSAKFHKIGIISFLTVDFDNGDRATSCYADPIVAGRWLNSRRSWPRIDVSGSADFVEEYNTGRRL